MTSLNVKSPDVKDEYRRIVDSVTVILNNWVIKQLFQGHLRNSQTIVPW